MLKWFRALMPKEDRFFELFDQHSLTLVAGAEALQALLRGGDADAIQRQAQRIIACEEDADDIAREVLAAVRRSFITPFDRSDIKDLIQSMDDAIDQMQKTVKAINLFELTSFDPMMTQLGDVIVEAARLTGRAVPLLRRVGRNATELARLAEEITRVEDRSDLLHNEGVRLAFQTHGRAGNAMDYIIGAEIYGHLEKVVDRFEDVANEISAIVLENV